MDAGEVLAHPLHLDQQVADRSRHDPSQRTNGTVADPRRPRPVLARSFPLLVQQRGDVGRVDVLLVVPVEAGVDVLRHRLLVEHLPGRLDGLEADADRVLGDRACFGPGSDRVHLLLARVVTDDYDLAHLVRLLHAVEHADRRSLVRAEDAFVVRVGLHGRLGDVGRLALVAAAVLRRDVLDVRGRRYLEQRDRRCSVERREADRVRLLVDRGLQHLDLLVDLRFVLRSLERDGHVVLRRGLLGALSHGLPELVLEALRDHRDEELGCCAGTAARTGAGTAAGRAGRRPAASGGDQNYTRQTAEPAHRLTSHASPPLLFFFPNARTIRDWCTSPEAIAGCSAYDGIPSSRTDIRRHAVLSSCAVGTARPIARTAGRALDLLMFLVERGQNGLTARELAQMLGAPRTSVADLLRVLENKGFVAPTAEGHGWRLDFR